MRCPIHNIEIPHAYNDGGYDGIEEYSLYRCDECNEFYRGEFVEEEDDEQKLINHVLGLKYWPCKLKTMEPYTSTHDDNDGDVAQAITVWVGPDGDLWVKTTGTLRFRMEMSGGGRYPKIRNALLLLAEAIRQEGHPPFCI